MAASAAAATRLSGGGVALLLLALLAAGTSTSSAQLSTGFYSHSCPGVHDAVRSVLQAAIAREQRMGASILRLFFHDCFGCDASLLLDDTPSFQGEKMAKPNNGSVRGFEVIDAIKSAVDKACPGVVSCADILAIAARDSVVTTPTVFENDYYRNLVCRKGLLHSDQELFNGAATDAQVQAYVSSQSAFFADFVAGMVKMGDISPLTGSSGEIRKNCRRIN
ncbi:Peroxidase 67 [Zea mays]|uniref:Peroxidase 67 n=1 Tax=Zea mays TaxID=4577 RepID=A0A1D6LS38_MAIZE|nr:Peroxidase 67 [Zea mays]